MAHTYDILPPSLSSILKDVVTKVSTAISSEIGFTVKYKHNGFEALMNELVADSNSSLRKNNKYPLIALIQPFKASGDGKSSGVDVDFDLIICTLTEATKPADERETDNYDAILRPIYAELLSQLGRDYRIYFKGRQPRHTHMDIYHLGDSRGGKNGYIFPDTVDAILIEGMQLHIESDDCIMISPPTPPCSTPIHEWDLLNYLKIDSASGVGGGLFTIGLIETFTSLQPAPTYRLNYGYPGVPDIENLDISAISLYSTDYFDEAGTYIVTITSSYGATLQIELILNGVAKWQSAVYVSSIEVNLAEFNCVNSLNYPYEIYYMVTGVADSFKNSEIANESGTVLFDKAYPVNTFDATETFPTFLTSLNTWRTIGVITNQDNFLENKIILNIKTI